MSRFFFRAAIVLGLIAAGAAFAARNAAPAPSRIHNVRDMNTTQIRALDKNRTAVLLPGGILEEHGPYLPAYTDGIFSEQLTDELAKAIAARTDWSVLVFPTVPLGSSGSNEYGGKFTFPGTYAVRSETLRAVSMDLATELGEHGFRWLFVINVHGAALHNHALDQAGDYFHDAYGGRMVHLWGQVPVIQGWGLAMMDGMTPEQKKEDGDSLHGGLDETSMMLYLRPELVSPDYKKAPPLTGVGLEANLAIARAKGWEGYFGSPRLADAALGKKIWTSFSAACVDYTLKVLGGLDPSKTQRYGDLQAANPELAALEKASLAHEREIAAKEKGWIEKNVR